MRIPKQKTDEEYEAMAVLLGYQYLSSYHMFDAVPHSMHDYKWLDPDTLVELDSVRDIERRRNRYEAKEADDQ